ncbi:hypothetical protein VQL36_18005 [Chengkuizengella sp. SCS-71B]|uniref:hypothetical protein n=1 Tax=Chengkuizengella sp. SCS-71B TaxID=3115290 RepID=UPI0032C240CD
MKKIINKELKYYMIEAVHLRKKRIQLFFIMDGEVQLKVIWILQKSWQMRV